MGYLRRSKIKPFVLLLAFTAVVILSYVFNPQNDSGQSIEGIVEHVNEGDIIVISPLSDEKDFTCRLYGIDAPEPARNSKPGQPFADEATEELNQLIYKKKVKVTFIADKSNRRESCIVQKDGLNVNLEMVNRGYAWAYREYLKKPHASKFLDAEKEARAKRLGLWQQNNPQPPWEFRQAQ